MNKQRITTKQLALCSVLLTLMLVLGWVESLFPPLLGGRTPIATCGG